MRETMMETTKHENQKLALLIKTALPNFARIYGTTSLILSSEEKRHGRNPVFSVVFCLKKEII